MTAIIPGMVMPDAATAAMMTGPYPDRWAEIEGKGTKKYPARSFFDEVDNEGTYDFNGGVSRNNMDDRIREGKYDDDFIVVKDGDPIKFVSSKDRLIVDKTKRAVDNGDYEIVQGVRYNDTIYVTKGHETVAAKRVLGEDIPIEVIDLSSTQPKPIADADETPKVTTTVLPTTKTIDELDLDDAGIQPKGKAVYIEAGSRQQAAEFGRTLGYELDYSSNYGPRDPKLTEADEIDTANTVNKHMTDLYNEGIFDPYKSSDPTVPISVVIDSRPQAEGYAGYRVGSDTIEINAKQTVWRGDNTSVVRDHKDGWSTTTDARSILIHENGHREHAIHAPGSFEDQNRDYGSGKGWLEGDLIVDPGTDNEHFIKSNDARKIANGVSTYAGTHSIEYVAEAYTVQTTGGKLSQDQLDLYNALDGPPIVTKKKKPQKTATPSYALVTHPSDIPLTPGKSGMVMDEEEARELARKNGSPLAEETFYHFTSDRAPDRVGETGIAPSHGVFGYGIYTTNSSTSEFSGARGADVRFKVVSTAKSPLRMNREEYASWEVEMARKHGVEDPATHRFRETRDYLQLEGHDAIVFDVEIDHPSKGRVTQQWYLGYDDNTKVVKAQDNDIIDVDQKWFDMSSKELENKLAKDRESIQDELTPEQYQSVLDYVKKKEEDRDDSVPVSAKSKAQELEEELAALEKEQAEATKKWHAGELTTAESNKIYNEALAKKKKVKAQILQEKVGVDTDVTGLDDGAAYAKLVKERERIDKLRESGELGLLESMDAKKPVEDAIAEIEAKVSNKERDKLKPNDKLDERLSVGRGDPPPGYPGYTTKKPPLDLKSDQLPGALTDHKDRSSEIKKKRPTQEQFLQEDADLKEKTKPFIKTLTKEQRRAIESYTDSGYEDVNQWLRDGDSYLETLTPKTQERVRKRMALIEEGISKSTLDRDMILYRGTRLSGGIPDTLKNLRPGDTVTDLGFGSTSLDPQWAKSETAGGGSKDQVTYELMAPKGTRGLYVEGITESKEEYEVILDRGSTFVVHEVRDTPSGVHIVGEIVG